MTPTEKQKCIAEQSVYGDLWGIEAIEYTDHIDKYIYKWLDINDVQLIEGDEL